MINKFVLWAILYLIRLYSGTVITTIHTCHALHSATLPYSMPAPITPQIG